jgi:hypothetical protein
MTDDDTTPSAEATGEADSDSNGEELTAADDDFNARQEFQMRYALAQALGENLPGDEDYYEVFSWDKHPTVNDFYALALRNPYAYLVTFFWPELCWRDAPKIVDDAEQEDGTPFEQDVQELVDDTSLWHYAQRIDKLAGIGKFGVLVIEFDDIDGAEGLETPVGNPQSVNGLRPFSRASISDVKLGGPGSDRWGEPVKYQLDFSDENETESVIEQEGPETVWVHWTRVIHVPSDELLDDEIRGIPRQKPVYNNLIDIEKSLGSAGELAYRASAWGININIDKDFDIDDGGDELKEHLARWEHGLENVLRTHGADDVQSLGGEEIDPSLITDPNIEALSAQTGIPQSVIKGNETGERATSEDLKEAHGRASQRRNSWINPQIVRALIDRFRKYDIVADPAGEGYRVEWDPLAEMDEKDQAEIQKLRAQMLKEWPFGEELLTPEQQRAFVKEGELPTELDESDLPPLDESNEQVEAQFERSTGQADD